MANNQAPKFRTICPTQTSESGVILPTGAVGKVLGYEQGRWILDFGLSRVIVMPCNSPLLELVSEVAA